MTIRPRRLSIGCYYIEANGRRILLQRVGRSGFKVVMRAGAMSPLFRRLRDAAAVAETALAPWPFPVEKRPDLAGDLPWFLDRRAG